MTTSLLTTKLYIPTISNDMVSRTELVNRLEEAAYQKFVSQKKDEKTSWGFDASAIGLPVC